MVKKLIGIPSLICIFFLVSTSCGRPDHIGSTLTTGMPVYTVTQAIEPSRLGKVIQVRGEVNEVCQDEGCWMTIMDSDHGLRVTFANGGFVVPMDLQGSVIVEGTIHEEVFGEEDAKLLAETMGWDEKAIKAIQGDTRLPMLVATGVKFEDQ